MSYASMHNVLISIKMRSNQLTYGAVASVPITSTCSWFLLSLQKLQKGPHVIQQTIQSMHVMYTVCETIWPRSYCLNNSVKNKPIWIIFVIRNPEEILYKCYQTCPPYLKKMLPLYLVKCRKYHFQRHQQLDIFSEHEIVSVFHQWIALHCSYAVNVHYY